jgi:microcystin-dependent protein
MDITLTSKKGRAILLGTFLLFALISYNLPEKYQLVNLINFDHVETRFIASGDSANQKTTTKDSSGLDRRSFSAGGQRMVLAETDVNLANDSESPAQADLPAGASAQVGQEVSSAKASADQGKKTIQLTGTLTNNQGQLVDGDYSVRFAIYTSDRKEIDPYPSDTDKKQRLWEETRSIKIKKGTFLVNLGEVTDLPLLTNLNSSQFYVGLRIGTDSEMAPRRKVSTPLFSLNSANALRLNGKQAGLNPGDIIVLNTSGQINIENLPTGTKKDELVMGNDKRLKFTITGASYASLSGQKFTLNDIDLASDITSILKTMNGGTGLDSYTQGDLLYYNAGETLTRLPIATDGQILTVASGIPTWSPNNYSETDPTLTSWLGSTNLTTLGTITTGSWNGTTISPTKGGTGLITAPGNGQLLIGDGTGYQLSTLTPGTGISITSEVGVLTIANAGVTSLTGTTDEINLNSSTGSITLSLPQPIAQTSTPTFATISTGLGQFELYAMNQNVRTTDSPTFSSLTLSSALTSANGGTGLVNYTPGDLLYYSTGTTLSQLAIGTSGQVLKSTGATVAWNTLSKADIGLENVPNLTFSGSNTGDNATNSQYSGLATAKQDALSGTGFVKISGTAITYDNSTYLTALTGAVLTSQTTPQTIGDTTNRLQKLWTTDLTVTNVITGSITGNAGTVTSGVYTNAANSMTLINPLTTLAESWLGPSATTGIYFKAGNIGLGTTNPFSQLTVLGATTQLSLAYDAINYANFTVDNASNLTIQPAVVSATTRIGAGAESMRIDPNGNVGIGTTGPISILDVSGNIMLSGGSRYINFNATAGLSGYGIRDNAGNLEYKISGGNWMSFGSGATSVTSTDSVPIGTVSSFPMATCPAGWVEANGASVSTATYANLYTQIGYTYGGSGASFTLPDYRGQFLRGWANGSTVDPDRAARTNRGDGTTGDVVGSKQAGATASHLHAVDPPSTASSSDGNHTHTFWKTDDVTSSGDWVSPVGNTSAWPYESWVSGMMSTAGAHTHTTNISQFNSANTGGNETRPTNVNVLYCIKVSNTANLWGILGNDTYYTTGNVGIGTTGPSQLFQVGPTVPTGSIPYSLLNGLRVSGGDTSNSIWQSVANTNLTVTLNSTSASNYIGLGNSSNNGTSLVVTGAGSVGIGTTGPNGKLDVAGGYIRALGGASGGAVPSGGKGLEMTFDSSTNIGYILGYNRDTSTRLDMSLGNTSSPLYLQGISGNVGIGTTSPRGKLEIPSNTVGSVIIGTPNVITDATVDIGTAAGATALSLTDSAYAHTYFGFQASGPIGANIRSDNSLSFYAGNTQYMTLLNTGNVGIGTTGPNAKLHIYNSSVNGDMYLTDSTLGAGYGGVVRGYGAGGAGGFLQLGTLDNSVFYPAITVSQQASGVGIGYANPGTAKLAINGNVGIGTTSPGKTLEVNGSFNLHGGNYYTSYTPDGLWGTAATPNYLATTAGGRLVLGYQDNGAGLYGAAYGFEVKHTDGLSRNVTYNAIIMRDSEDASQPFYITNKGDGYFGGNVSAASFTDRTPYPKDLETAYESVLSMQRLPDGEYEENNKKQQLDHSLLSPFIRASADSRDLSASVSSINEVTKYLLNQIGGINTTGTIIDKISGLTENQNILFDVQTQNFASLQNQLADQSLTIDNKLQLIGQNLDSIQTQIIASLQEQIDLQTQDLASLRAQMADIQTNMYIERYDELWSFYQNFELGKVPLKNALENVFEGKITAQDIEALNTIKAKDIEATNNIKAENDIEGRSLKLSSDTSGKSLIEAGKTEIIVDTPYASETVKISLTPKGSTSGKNIYIDDIVEGESFKVKIDAPAVEKDVHFYWFIIK